MSNAPPPVTNPTGLTYAFNSLLTACYIQKHSIPNMLGPNASIQSYLTPLAFEPGTRFQYGIGIDWAGHLVSRISGLTLEEYFSKHIWGPCGIAEISFHPPSDAESTMMAMTTREPMHTGNVVLLESAPLGRTLDREKIHPPYSGGGGLFGTARDYLTFLRHVLASAEPNAKVQLLQPDTFKLLFRDTLPDDPVIRKDLAAMAQRQCIHDPALLTDGTGEYIGYGPGLFINKQESKWGRKAMSGFWDGAAKTMFWIDPTSGIAVSGSGFRKLTQGCVSYEYVDGKPGSLEPGVQPV